MLGERANDHSSDYTLASRSGQHDFNYGLSDPLVRTGAALNEEGKRGHNQICLSGAVMCNSGF